MSQDFNTDLARRFRGVPIARGMLARSAAGPGNYLYTVEAANGAAGPGKYLYTVEAANGTRVLLSSLREAAGQKPALVPMGWFDAADLLPDYRDAGTLGHLLAAVRAAWKRPTLCVDCCDAGAVQYWWTDVVDNPRDPSIQTMQRSEAEALAAAWEARPGREVEHD